MTGPRVGVVTGAASGIGRALVLLLHRNGDHVWAVDISAGGLNDLAAECPGIRIRQVNVSDRDQVERLLADVVASEGRIDLLFNNAGVLVGGDFEAADEATLRRIVDVNLWGVVYGTQIGYRFMLAQGHGQIVNTASSAGVMPVNRSAAYAATKHAVVGLSTSLRAEAAARGIKVNVVIPGLVDTGIFDAATNMPGYDYAREMDKLPFAKITPDKAAQAILDGVRRNDAFIVFPLYNRVLRRLYGIAPGLTGSIITR